MDLVARISELEALATRQAAIIAQQQAIITQQQATIADLTEKLSAMDARLTAMTRRMFGSSSERFHDPGQQSLDLGDHRPFVDAAAAVEATAAPANQSTGERRRRPRRPRLPANTIVVERVIDLPESEKFDADGRPLRHLSNEVAERLHYIPPHFERHLIIRPVYGHPFSDQADRVVAVPPAFLVEKGLPTDELAIQVLISKYADHLPLYRQSAMWARQDVHLHRSTLCGWVAAVADRLRGVWAAIGDEVRSERFLHLDDTPINVLAKKHCVIGRLWTYGIAGAVHLRFSPNRAGCWPSEFLRDYRGFVVGDAYAGHNALFEDGWRIDVGCWAHVRRKFEEIYTKEPEAEAMLRRISRLYAIESAMREAAADEPAVLQRRSRDVIPLLNDIRGHLDRLLPTTTPRSPLGKAIAYALGQWTACTRYADTGFLPIDNNLAERSLRSIAVGRKNYLFLGSGEDGGGDWAAIAYSVIGSCRLNGLDPYRYLLDIAPMITARGFANHAAITPRAWARKAVRTLAA